MRNPKKRQGLSRTTPTAISDLVTASGGASVAEAPDGQVDSLTKRDGPRISRFNLASFRMRAGLCGPRGEVVRRCLRMRPAC